MLQKQIISLPLQLGIDTKDAPPLIQHEKFVTLQNARFIKGVLGQIHKRNGYQRLTQVDTNANALTSGQALAQLNGELDLFSNDALYAYAPSQDAWAKKGTIIPVVPTETKIVNNRYTQSAPDSQTLSGVTLYAWQDTRGGVWIKCIDATTGAVLIPDTQFDTTGSMPRVIINGSDLVVFSSSYSGFIYYGVVNPTAPTAPMLQTLISSIGGPSQFDIYPSGGAFIVYYVDESENVTLANMSTSYVLSNTSPQENGSTGINSGAGCNVGGGNFFFCWVDSSSSLQISIVEQANVGNLSAFSSNSIGNGTSQLVCWYTGASGVTVIAEFTPTAFDGVDRSLVALYCSDATVTSDQVIARGIGLSSELLSLGGNAIRYFMAVYPSAEQQTYFLIQTNGTSIQVVGRFLYSNAGPDLTVPRLSSWAFIKTNVYSIAIIEANSIIAGANDETTTIFGVTDIECDFSQTTAIRSAVLGLDLAVAGSLPQVYDQTSLTEQGFNIYPEIVSAQLLTSWMRLDNLVFGANIGGATTANLTFPVNPDGSGNDGEMIKSGEYLVVFGADDSGGLIFWFDVDNSLGGVPPSNAGSGSDVTFIEVPINSTDSADVVAATFDGLFSAATLWTSVVTGAQVAMSAASGVTPPWLNTQSNVWITFSGSGGQMQFSLWALPAVLIQPGQYFTFQCWNGSAQLVNVYLWFTIAGVGVDPNPFHDNALGIEVSCGATDSESQVATNIYNALSPYAAGLGLIGGQDGTLASVSMLAANNGAVTTPSSVTMGRVGLGTSTAGAPLSYQVAAVYEQTDAQGALNRSAPSVATTFLVPNYGLSNAIVQYTVSTLRLSARNNVDIAIYRTPANGQDFQRITSPTDLLRNDPTIDSVTWVDAVEDTALDSAEFLYTTGGVVQNDPAPAMQQIVSHQDRLWACGLEDPQLIWWSKFFENGVNVEWSAYQTTRIDEIAGEVKKLVSMDGNLIVFGTNQIWLIAGVGPNAAGGGTPFNPPQIISSACGIRDPQSAVLTPNGIIFKSIKGFYLLDRSLGVTYIGMPVEAFNSDVVTGATVVPNTTEVRFLSNLGTTLLYDYQFDQWCSFTNHAGVDALVYDGVYYYLRSSAAVFGETQGYYWDDMTGFPLVAQTAWLNLSNIQGFMRVWKMFLLGQFPASNAIQVEIAYNYVSTVVDTLVLNGGAGQTGSGSATHPFNGATYIYTLPPDIFPGTVQLEVSPSGPVFGTDNGDGVISGTSGTTGACSGTINYTTGALAFTIANGGITSTNFKISWQTVTSGTASIQFKIWNSIQSCEAIQLTVQDLPAFWDSASGMGLNALDLECGMKRGGMKLGPPNVAG